MEKKKIELKNFEDEYLIKVQGGKYVPSFTNELKEVFDIDRSMQIYNNSINVAGSNGK